MAMSATVSSASGASACPMNTSTVSVADRKLLNGTQRIVMTVGARIPSANAPQNRVRSVRNGRGSTVRAVRTSGMTSVRAKVPGGTGASMAWLKRLTAPM
jgi:hypothetical protein